MVPQVEFDEFEGRSMIAATVGWDNGLSRTYGQAIAALEATMCKAVLACSSRILTVEIDTLEWLRCLKIEADNGCQFCLQPPESLAFFGNTSVCSNTLIEPNKALRKLARVQHLYAQLTGTLQKEEDEF